MITILVIAYILFVVLIIKVTYYAKEKYSNSKIIFKKYGEKL